MPKRKRQFPKRKSRSRRMIPFRKRFRRKQQVPRFTIKCNPNSISRSFKWSGIFDLETSGLATTIVWKSFRANSARICDVAIGTTDALCWQEEMKSYGYSTCVGSQATVTFVNNDVNPVLVYLDKGTISPVQTVDRMIVAERYTSSKYMLPGTGSDNRITLKKNFSTKKNLGVSHPVAEDTVRQTWSGLPNMLYYFHVGVAPTNEAVVPARKITAHVNITYRCVLTDVKEAVI